MKYTIIHVNDRCVDLMNENKNILKSFDYVDDIVFFNGNVGNASDILNDKGISQDVWSPYDGRQTSPLPGELGIWVSTLNCWQYMVDNNIETLLMLEDDISLNKNFVKNLKLCLKDLPKNFDFLSLFYFEDQNKLTEDTDIKSKYIHRASNQYSAGQAIMYSLKGAKKMLKLIRRKGLEYTADCFIFEQARLGFVNGYSIVPNNLSFLDHKNKEIISIIDPDNFRNTNEQ